MKRREKDTHAVAPAPDEPRTTEHWTVDSLEDTPHGQVARVERPGGQMADISVTALPAGLREGDILGVQVGPDGIEARLLPAETAQAQREAQSRLQALNEAGASAGQEITL